MSDAASDHSTPLLSEELALELTVAGGSSVVLPGKKSEKNEEKSCDKRRKEAEIRDFAQILGKKALKRLEQIRKRKSREMQRDEYLRSIKKNEISLKQRQLLLPTSSSGQTQTVKQRLTTLHRKQQAGLSLTDEEMSLLYCEGYDSYASLSAPQVAACEASHDLNAIGDEMIDDARIQHSEIAFNPPSTNSDLLFQFDSIVDSDFVPETKVKRRKKETVGRTARDLASATYDDGAGIRSIDQPVEQTPSESASSSSLHQQNGSSRSIGQSLLSQIQCLTHLTKKNIKDASFESSAVDAIKSNEETQQRYLAHSIVSPVDAIGEIVHSVTPRQGPSDSTTSNEIALARSARALLNRPADVTATRLQLPACGMEQEIVEAVHANDVIIVCGETGSGKSTQIPQFLYEAGYATPPLPAGHENETEFIQMIGITQPRRVAVTTTAKRVLYEMTGQANFNYGGDNLVGYQIRFDARTVNTGTRIKFMTDGILLQEASKDILLSRYRVIVLDEAHERNMNTDVLLGLLSRSVKLRRQRADAERQRWESLSAAQQTQFQPPLPPLKLLIMSATLRTEDFCAPVLFGNSPPPIISIEARQYPVTVHFSRRTELKNYLKAAQRKVVQIHRQLPADGGILVFATGKREILTMCSKLRRSLNKETPGSCMDNKIEAIVDAAASNALAGAEETWTTTLDERMEQDEDIDGVSSSSRNSGDDDDDSILSIRSNISHTVPLDSSSSSECTNNNMIESTNCAPSVREKMLQSVLGSRINEEDHKNVTESMAEASEKYYEVKNSSKQELRAWVLPLYAMMPPHDQAKVFQAPPPGHRLIVVATNVAETSITIPGIKYVVDTGRQKEKVPYTAAAADDDGEKEFVDSSTAIPSLVATEDSRAAQNAAAGITKFAVRWISQASAMQRAGRAGRTGPGHCYRLYSAAFFHDHMRQFQAPEITVTPLEELILQMKALGIEQIEKFPFPTAPPTFAIRNSLVLLRRLGALMMQCSTKPSTFKQSRLKIDTLTSLGQLLSMFPVNPRYGKMLIVAMHKLVGTCSVAPFPDGSKPLQQQQQQQAFQFLSASITLVAALSEGSVFADRNGRDHAAGIDSDTVESSDKDDTPCTSKNNQRTLFFHRGGDAIARFRAIGAFSFHAQQQQRLLHLTSTPWHSVAVKEFCITHGLHLPTIRRVIDLRTQLRRIVTRFLPRLMQAVAVNSIIPHNFDDQLNIATSPPSPEEEVALQQLLICAFPDSIARKVPLGTIKTGSRRRRSTAYCSCNPAIEEALYLHPSQCNLYRQGSDTSELPEFVLYGMLQRSARGDSVYMSCVTVIEPAWIALVLSSAIAGSAECPLLHWSDPLSSPLPYYDESAGCIMSAVIPSYGARKWILPVMRRPLRDCTAEQGKAANAKNRLPVGFRPEDECYRWFARLLLEGRIPLPMVDNKTLDAAVVDRKFFSIDVLNERSAAAITKAVVTAKASKLLRQLVKNEIESVDKLMEKLCASARHSSQSLFLEDEITEYLQKEQRELFRRYWAALAQQRDVR